MVVRNSPPYPGLRSFRREETDLFFGRDNCVDAMIEGLAETRFLSVLGSSGTGKSSLVEAGLLSALDMGLMPRAGSRWRVVNFRPGGSPLRNLAQRLLEIRDLDAEAGQLRPDDVNVNLLRARLKREPGAILDWYQESHLAGTNMLLLVDQFEELFRYEDYAGREEAEAFVARLLEVREFGLARSAQREAPPIYIAITMRSEYLGACSLIEGLAEAINEGAFLTPRMTRDECREAIEGPAKVCGIEIEESLVNRLLNDLADFASWDDGSAQARAGGAPWPDERDRVGGQDQLSRLARRADQLPLMQHALNRMWEEVKANSGPPKLTLADYENIGGLQGAIDKHANKIVTQLEMELGKSRGQSTTSAVFRAVTSGTTAADAVRRPTPFGHLATISGDEEGVRAVVEAFRSPGCNFLTPESSIPLLSETYIDIGHESLIRQWSRLSEWLEQEARASHSWYRLRDAAASYQRGEGGLLEGRNLDTLVAWRETTKPNAAWASRYGGDYPEVMGFLSESMEARGKKDRKQRVARMATAGLGFAVVGIVTYLVVSQSQKENERLLAEDARRKIEFNLTKLNDNVRQTAQFVLTNIAAKVQPYQVAGEWSAAWNLLAHTFRDVESLIREKPDIFDESAAQTLSWRALEQHLQAPSDVANTIQKLEGENIEQLETRPAGRFGLFWSKTAFTPRLYLFDKWSGAILGRSGELPDMPRSSNPEALGSSEIAIRDQYLSSDGQNAIVVLKSGRVFKWDTVKNALTEIMFDLEKVTSEQERSERKNPIGASDILSVAFERMSDRVALVLKAKGQSPRIVFSTGNSGPPIAPIEIAGLSRKFDERAADDLRSVEVHTFAGNRLLVELHHGSRPDGYATVNVASGLVTGLLTWPAIADSGQVSPDNRIIVTTPQWDREQRCHPTSGQLTSAPGAGEPAYDSGACLVIIDLVRDSATLVGRIPSSASVLSIEKGSAGQLDKEGYQILLRAAGAHYLIEIERADDGSYVIRDQASARVSAFPPIALRHLAVRSTWPLPIVTPSFVIASRSGQLASIGRANESQVPLILTRYQSGTHLMGPLRADLSSETRTLALEMPGLRLNNRSFRGAFAGDNQLLLTVNASKVEVPSQAGGTTQLYAAIIDLDAPAQNTVQWIEVKPSARDCRDVAGSGIALREIRYWGSQPRDTGKNEASTSANFIGIDDSNHLWAVSSNANGRTVTMECMGGLIGRSTVLDIGTVQGRAVVQSNSTIYVYALREADQVSSAAYTQTALALPETPAAASFMSQSQLALATKNGDIWLAQHDKASGEWSAKSLAKGVVSETATLVTDNEQLLIVGRNGYAVALAFAGGRLVPLGLASLPRPPTGAGGHYDVSFGARERMINLVQSGTVSRYPLQNVPADDRLRQLIANRGSVVLASERESADLVMRLIGVRDPVESNSRTLIPLDAKSKCRLSTGALLSLEESNLDNPPPVARVRELARNASRYCGDAEAHRSGDAAVASSNLVLKVLADSDHRVAGWPREWSLLIRTAARGNPLALRALVLALKRSDQEYLRKAAQSVWKGMRSSGELITSDKIALYYAGAPIENPVRKALENNQDAADPNTHLLLGHLHERRGDRENLLEALFHFWIAEELYRASARSQDEKTASIRRALVARAVPDDAVQDVRSKLITWRFPFDTPRGGAASESLADDLRERIVQDIAALDEIAKRQLGASSITLIRAALFWFLGELQKAEDMELAIRSYRNAVTALIEVVDHSSLDVDLLTEWSNKLISLRQDQFASQVLAKTLMAFEATKPDGIAGENDLRGYNKILSEFNNVLERSAASAEESVKSLKFRPYLFDYGSVGRSSIKLRALARKVLEEQRKLVGTLLKDGDDNPNWITQRGITAFWLAVVDLDDAQEGGQKDADRLNSRGNDYLDSAIEDFSTLVKSAKSDPDLSYLLAEALRWRSGRFKNGRREYEANLLAKRAYETAISAFENGRWNPPRDIGAGLYSEYADVLLLGSRGITILLDERNDDWNAEDREVLDAFWGSLYNAQQWEQARRKADATPGSSEWGRRVNAGPGFALGMLGGHLKLFGSVGHTSVNECDRLASSFADPLRRWRSTEFKQIDRDKAKGQCLNAVKMNDGDPHYKYLASRITWEMSFAIDAANGGYPAALNQVRFILETLPRYKSEDSRGRLHLLKESLERAYNQRILLSVFSTVYDFLKDKARDENERNSLKWIAAQAANAGVPAGHIALADLADSDTQRYFHLRIGAELMQKQSLGNATSESEIRSRLDRLQLSTDDLERLNRDIKSWVAPDSPVDVSTLLKELQAALN